MKRVRVDSDEAAAKMVAVVVAGLVVVAGIGYIAYSLGTGNAATSDGGAAASTEDERSDADATPAENPSADDDAVPADPVSDIGDGGGATGEGDNGGEEDGGDGSTCMEDCDDEDTDEVGVPFTLEPLGLYLGATSDDCEQDLLLDTDIGATVVESCKKVTSGNTVSMTFTSDQEANDYVANATFAGTIHLKIDFVPGVAQVFFVEVGFICDGTSWFLEEQRFQYADLTPDEDGFRPASFSIPFDHGFLADQGVCDPAIKVMTNAAASSVEFRFDPDMPSFTDLSVAQTS